MVILKMISDDTSLWADKKRELNGVHQTIATGLG